MCCPHVNRIPLNQVISENLNSNIIGDKIVASAFDIYFINEIVNECVFNDVSSKKIIKSPVAASAPLFRDAEAIMFVLFVKILTF